MLTNVVILNYYYYFLYHTHELRGLLAYLVSSGPVVLLNLVCFFTVFF